MECQLLLQRIESLGRRLGAAFQSQIFFCVFRPEFRNQPIFYKIEMNESYYTLGKVGLSIKRIILFLLNLRDGFIVVLIKNMREKRLVFDRRIIISPSEAPSKSLLKLH